MAEVNITPHRWSRREYDRMVESGVFAPGARLELLDGEIVDMTPQGSAHATVTQLVEEALRAAFGPGFSVRVQMPLAIDDSSEPEPDVAVVKGSPRDYLQDHPDSAMLVVEVADSTLSHDRERKKHVYARNAIPEYWIVDVGAGRVEVYRYPAGDDYASKATCTRGDRIQPLAARGVAVAVGDILP